MIENPPENFVSFSEDDYCGYIVDLNYVKNKDTKKGYDYKKYMFGAENKTLTFGKTGEDNDVYIYDATGKVFYAKGVYAEGGVYYSDILTQDGPIINVTKTYNEATNVVDMIIKVEPVTPGNTPTVRIDNSMALDAETEENTYKYTASSNGIYVVSAEEGELTSVKRVKVSDITEGEYNITYHFQDGKTADEVIKKQGSLSIRLKAAKRDGYVHVGWSKNPSDTSAEYEPGGLFAENADTDLYAVWELGQAREFTITFNANGGENPPAPITKTERASLSLPIEEPTYLNHVFRGWSLSSDATEPDYLAGANYSREGDTVLFAVWQKGENRVDFVSNPVGAGTAVGGGIKEAGSIVYITAVPNPGYVFSKWTVTSNNVKLDNNYSETTRFVMPKGTVKITVNFKKTDYDYTIKYNANNGYGAPNTQYKKHDESINISATIPTRSGHQFLGWSDKINSTTVKYLPGDSYDKNESCTLYAVWKRNENIYTLTFDANGGTKAPSSITAVKDSLIRIPTESPIRSNLLFLGWATQKDATQPEYRKNDYYTLNDNATLYAVWSDSEKPVVSITAEEKDNQLVLKGYAVDNGGIIKYAWTNEFYSESEQASISWTTLSSAKSEITIRKDVLNSGIHCFYVKDESGNVSYSSIDVYKMTFYNEEVLFETKYKASGYPASMSQYEPWKAQHIFSKWKAETDGRLYNVDEKYILEKDEEFVATWGEAYAYIPSTNLYYATLQKAVDAVLENTTDYVEIQLIKTETTEGVTIPKNKKVAVSMASNILKCAQTAITVEKDAKFRLIDGNIESSVYGIRNAGTLELLKGKITAQYGVYNTGATTLGDEKEEFSKTSIVISSTKESYGVGTGATLYFANGSLEDTAEGEQYELPASGLTLRKNFELRKITSANGSASKIITTIIEDLIISRAVTAGSASKPVEIKLTLSLASPSNKYVFQYSEDGSTWKNGSEVTIIDNKTIYGRILEDGIVANTEQLSVNDIVDLVVTFDAGGIITNPSAKTVKYKRTYGDVIPATTDTNGYFFKGWWTAASGGTQVISTTTVTAQGDHTLYAHWEPKYPCECDECTTKVPTQNTYCSFCENKTKCSSGSCTSHCSVRHTCSCSGCNSSVFCNMSYCSTCSSVTECNGCYHRACHYTICSSCRYCISCGCKCSTDTGSDGGDSGTGGNTGEDSNSCQTCGGDGRIDVLCGGSPIDTDGYCGIHNKMSCHIVRCSDCSYSECSLGSRWNSSHTKKSACPDC